MVFNNRIKEVQEIVYDRSKIFFDSIAEFLGYPDVPGMPILPLDPKARDQLMDQALLPKHITYIPPGQAQRPENLTEALFGTFPYTMPVEKHFYEHKAEGYYNFYIENYRNMYFLPDWLSGYIQIHFNITVDHSSLELCRDVFFYVILLYGFIVSLRTTLFWMLAINPYTLPWVTVVDFVDWIYDGLAGILPCVLGIDLAPTVLGMVIGKIADSGNHLVFTMPFLPSEGNQVKMLIDGEIKDVVQFHYLPYLWYRYPIPMNLREFWYSERPDILNFMEKNYSQFGINFRPLLSGSEVTSILDSTTFVNSIITTSKDFSGLL
uniref:Uncharacterized protein n=1 Tax=Thalassiosira duostra TaxID=3145220 RepID=A0AB74TPP6_9STRA